MKLRNIAFLLFFLTQHYTYSLSETSVLLEVSEKMNQDYKCLNTTESFWKRKVIETPLAVKSLDFSTESYRLRYSQFGCDLGVKGSLVISPGRTESSPEYYETALDFINEGYSPIFVIDHRGQGLSPRLLSNRQKGHIETFKEYVSDFSFFTSAVLKTLKEMGNAKQPLYFTSNSMGGAIGIGYFQQVRDNNPYKVAAILGSQIKVNYLGVVKKDPTTFNNILYTEAGVIAQANYHCSFGRCGEYASEVFAGYKPEKRVFEASEDNMTHSEQRYELRNFIWDQFDWSEIMKTEYLPTENWSSPVLGGATFSWARAAAKFNKKMRRKRNIKKMNIPLLVLTGEKDIRAYTPNADGSTDLSSHIEFCNDVDKFSKSICRFIPLKDAFHELYKENDYFRDQSMTEVLNFFEKHK